MTIKAKFVCLSPYNFDRDGIHFEGVNVFAFYDNKLLKCKLMNADLVKGKHFGDEIEVGITFSGRYVKYVV